MNSRRPILIYDGDCHFCTRWIARWRVATGDKVEYRAVQDGEFPEIPPGAAERSVQFLDAEGRRFERARAVFLALATNSWIGRALDWAYRKVPGFAAVSDGFYDVVAKNRMLFSRATRLLWGRDVLPPSYAVATMLFLRLLGLIYLIAFVSYGVQADGLIGPNGILPVAQMQAWVAEHFADDAWHVWPSLTWLGPPDVMVTVLTWVGVLCAVLVMLGMWQPFALAGAWICYLSLVTAGQLFYLFQWDSLLLETGLLAVFAAPCFSRPNLKMRRPSRLAHFLLVWLLFRLMFASGVVKLTSGDPVWHSLEALEFHYFTQPIPNPIAWFVAQAPAWFQKVSCGIMFAIELVLPFFVFLPRRPRMIAFFAFFALQVVIELTGNYGFFNLLTAALALLLVDDAVWPRIPAGWIAQKVTWSRWILIPVAAAYFLLSLVPLAGTFRTTKPIPTAVLDAYEWLAPFRFVNGYGLFARMTTERPEILVQGSNDGRVWETYEFKYKPGRLDRPPPFVAPYMPRLDWQMWFAALGDVRRNPWFLNFMARLFEARPEVLALLASDPFEGKPPRYLRALVDEYRFTTFAERRASGDWWATEPRGIYLPEIRREQLE